MMQRPFLAIAIVEHHQQIDPQLSPYDMNDRLETLWAEIEAEIGRQPFDMSIACIEALHRRVAAALDRPAGPFRAQAEWETFVAELGGMFDEDPEHLSSWSLSTLYWEHLTALRLPTAWVYVNALRLQKGLPVFRLSEEKLGEFLGALSSSGRPINDGQTFYPSGYD